MLKCLSPKTTAWNEFSSTMAFAIICLATNQKFNFSKLIFDSMVRNLDNLSGKFLMYPRNMKRVGKGFSGRVTPLNPVMVVQNQPQQGKGSAISTDPQHTPTILHPSTSQPQKTQTPRELTRMDIEIPQSSGPMENVVDEATNEAVYKELDDSLVRAATTSSSLEAEWDSGGSPRRQETIRHTIAQTRFENVSKLSNDPLLARDDADMFDVNTLTGDETIAATLKSVKPKVKANVVEEPNVPVSATSTKVSAATITITATIPTPRKGIVITKLVLKELEQESIKKQKVDEDKETSELQSLIEVIPNEEDVAIDTIGKKAIIKEDLEDLYKLIKAKYESTRLVEDLDLILYGDLKTMFEPRVEDQVWKNQDDYNVLD
ncbi:hypothetical protein Tco_0943358 [Tanacetum coccineum]